MIRLVEWAWDLVVKFTIGPINVCDRLNAHLITELRRTLSLFTVILRNPRNKDFDSSIRNDFFPRRLWALINQLSNKFFSFPRSLQRLSLCSASPTTDRWISHGRWKTKAQRESMTSGTLWFTIVSCRVGARCIGASRRCLKMSSRITRSKEINLIAFDIDFLRNFLIFSEIP